MPAKLIRGVSGTFRLVLGLAFEVVHSPLRSVSTATDIALVFLPARCSSHPIQCNQISDSGHLKDQ